MRRRAGRGRDPHPHGAGETGGGQRAGQDEDADDEAEVVRLLVNSGGTLVTTLTTPNGTWTVNTTTGAVTFTPAAGFTGATSPVTYQVSDTGGQSDRSSSTVTVSAVSPTAVDDTSTTPQGSPVTVDVLANDTAGNPATPLDPTSVVWQPQLGATLSTDRKTLTLPGEGTYVIDPTTAVVTYTPAPTFRGAATAVTYRVVDTDGGTSDATLTVTVTAVQPVAVDDTATTAPQTPVTLDVLGNDTAGADNVPLSAATLRLRAPAVPGAVLSTDALTLTVPGEGTYVADPGAGTVTFTPADTFDGAATPVTYEVADTNGTVVTAEITVSVGDYRPCPDRG